MILRIRRILFLSSPEEGLNVYTYSYFRDNGGNCQKLIENVIEDWYIVVIILLECMLIDFIN